MQSTTEEEVDSRQRKIANVLETYFSDASLLWDKFMLSKLLADPDGMVSFESLVKLPKFRPIQDLEPVEIKNSAEKYSFQKLRISKDQLKIGRIKPYIVNKKEELDDWSIYVEGLQKPYDNEQSISELFNKLVGHVSFFRIPPNQHNSTQFFGYCFIEFDSKENVQRAIDLVNRYNTSGNTNKSMDENTKLIDKLSLRVMSKLDWNKLKDEYTQLLADRKRDIKQLWDNFYEAHPDGEYDTSKKAKVEEEKPYEEGIIVFVDGLHPQSTRATATTLLQISGITIAFMNIKKKGLSTTHIRLKSPEDAKKICDYFNQEHFTVQETEKDTAGKQQESKTFDCLKLRLITGTEEEVYWENEFKQQKK